MQWVFTYLAALVTFGALDAAWIALVVRKLYELELGEIMREHPRIVAGILFYLVYAAGVTAFAVLPLTLHFDGVHASTTVYSDVAIWGAALGFFAYATYTLTNRAIIREWKLKLVMTDVAWGSLLTALASIAAFGVFRALA